MIEIGINPNLLTLGPLTLSWHGVMAFLGVALAVYLVGRWAPEHGISADNAYSTATWAIIGGILGARLVFVVDDWGYYRHNLEEIVFIWQGGLAIWGGFLGGFAGGLVYARLNKIPWAPLADITAPSLPLALMIGRIGDIINGEHFGEMTTRAWGVVYTHPTTQRLYQNNGLDPEVSTHPAVFYEFLWLVVVFALLWWVLRPRLRPAGMLFAAFLATYAFGRFFILFFHAYDNWIGDLNEAQLISLAVLAVTVPILAFRSRLVAPPKAAPTDLPPVGTRRRRRRGAR